MNEVVWQKSSAHWFTWFDKIVLEASTIRITLVQCHFGLLIFRSFRSVIPYFSLVFFSVGSRAVFRGRKRSVNRLPSRVPPKREPNTLIRRSFRGILLSSGWVLSRGLKAWVSSSGCVRPRVARRGCKDDRTSCRLLSAPNEFSWKCAIATQMQRWTFQ